MNAAERAPFIAAIDDALLPLGFKRRKAYFEWNQNVDVATRAWIHLNFGLGVINPSYGVAYRDLAGQLPAEAGAVTSTFEMISAASGVTYSSATSAKLVAQHALEYAMPGLRELADRSAVIRRLESPAPRDWPVVGHGGRMRLLPLLLAVNGRRMDALDQLSAFEVTAPSVDQLRPDFGAFALHFRAKYEPRS